MKGIILHLIDRNKIYKIISRAIKMKYSDVFVCRNLIFFNQYESSGTWNLISFRNKYLVFVSEIGFYFNLIILRSVCIYV